MPRPLFATFAGGPRGHWRVDGVDAVIGSVVERLAVAEGPTPIESPAAAWVLRGLTSNLRYTNRSEVHVLAARQQELGRPLASRAALIPIRKTDA